MNDLDVENDSIIWVQMEEVSEESEELFRFKDKIYRPYSEEAILKIFSCHANDLYVPEPITRQNLRYSSMLISRGGGSHWKAFLQTFTAPTLQELPAEQADTRFARLNEASSMGRSSFYRTGALAIGTGLAYYSGVSWLPYGQMAVALALYGSISSITWIGASIISYTLRSLEDDLRENL